MYYNYAPEEGMDMAANQVAMRRSRWVLLALLAAEGHSLNPVQLQKSLFLLGKRRPREVGKGFYHFRAYDYGPFDLAVYTDADELAEQGLVTIDRSMGQSLRRFALTAGA